MSTTRIHELRIGIVHTPHDDITEMDRRSIPIQTKDEALITATSKLIDFFDQYINENEGITVLYKEEVIIGDRDIQEGQNYDDFNFFPFEGDPGDL